MSSAARDAAIAAGMLAEYENGSWEPGATVPPPAGGTTPPPASGTTTPPPPPGGTTTPPPPSGGATTPPPGGSTGGTTPPPPPGLDDMTTLAEGDVGYTPPTTPEAPKARVITDKETVTGQLNDLLSQDSKYMQSARANAMEKANSRGLINSSMAVGAGQKAAIDSALPIATSDANINANAGQAAQTAGHQLQQTGYQGDINAALQTQQGGEQRKTAAQQGLIQTTLNDQTIAANFRLQNENNAAQAALQIQLKDMGLSAEYAKMDADQRKQLTDSIGTATQQWTDFQKAIYQNKDMTPEAKAQALGDAQKGLKDYVNLTFALSGLKNSDGTPMQWNPGTGVTGTAEDGAPTGGTPPPPGGTTTPTGDDIAQTQWMTKSPSTLSSYERAAAADAGYINVNGSWVLNDPKYYVPSRSDTRIYNPLTGSYVTVPGTWQGR